MLSYAATDALQQMTIESLQSLAASEHPNDVRFNVVVLESNKALKLFQYPGTQTLYPEARFGYNRYCNIGAKHTSNPFVCFCNNDLHFHKGWATEILKVASARPEILSFGSLDPWLHQHYGITEQHELILGYEKMKHVTGWCFTVRREIFQTMGSFDEILEFWYVDDDYARTLAKHQIPHALVPASKVDHRSGQTIGSETVENKSRERLTSAQWIYYDYKWNHHSRIVYGIKLLRFHLGKFPGLRRIRA